LIYTVTVPEVDTVIGMMKVAGGGGDSSGRSTNQAPLYSKYPISSQWEFTLTNGDVVKGEIYCTDPVADVVVVQDALRDVRIIAAASISASKKVSESSANPQPKLPSTENILHSKKALEEREKRAIRIAQDSLKHLNPKVCHTEWLSSDSFIVSYYLH
jgi:hypothetical protein